MPVSNFIDFCVSKYAVIKYRIRNPVAGQLALLWQPFCAPLVGGRVVLTIPRSMNLIGTPNTELLQFLFEYVTWPCDLGLWPFDPGVISCDATRGSTSVPSWKMIWLTVLELGRLQFSIDRYLSPIFTFWGGTGVKFKFRLYHPKKALPWRERRKIAYCAWVLCPNMRPICVKLAICPDYPRRHSPLKFCLRGRVQVVVIYFKFHKYLSRSLGAVGVENRHLPLTWAHGSYNSLYYRTTRDQNLVLKTNVLLCHIYENYIEKHCMQYTQCCISCRSKTAKIKSYKFKHEYIC